MNTDKEIHHFLESMASLRKEKYELFNSDTNSPINFVLCTHVLPDGIGDLVHLKDFADYLESVPHTTITRVAFVLDTDMEKAASILEVGQSENYYLIPYTVNENGVLVLTDKGQDALKALQQAGILERSDFRMQISAQLQISDKNTFLNANGIFTQHDWLSFFEIRPGISAHQTKPYAQGLVYMGLEKHNKETGIKLNETISQLSNELDSQKISKKDIIDQHIKSPLVKKMVSQAISQDCFIATGYLHTKLTKQAYLTLVSKISEQKNILITSNQLNPATLKEMDLSSLSQAGIGHIVFHNSDGSESIIKIGDGQRQIDVLQMKDCSNDEINALFAIADTTCAAGDTSIGQVMSSLSLPFFDVVDNKRYFLDNQFLKFIQEFNEHQPLYDYINACVHLVTEDEINQEMLQKMIEIATEQRSVLLKQWQQITATIHQEFNAYDGLLRFVEENATYQFFALAAQELSRDLEGEKGSIFLQKYQEDFFNYLIHTEKTELLIKLLETRKLEQTTVLKIFEEKNNKIFKLILNADDDRLVTSILHHLDAQNQQYFLSNIFLRCAQNAGGNQWIKDKYADFVDCRSLENFSIDITMDIDEDYIIALCKKALEDNDEEYFKKLSSETLSSLFQILPTHLLPSGIEAILKTGISEEYLSDNYDVDAEEMMYPPETSENDAMDVKQQTLSALLSLPISDIDKHELVLLLDQPIELIKKEALDWLHSDLYEQNICNQVEQILTNYVHARLKEQTLNCLFSLPISEEDKEELVLLIDQPVEVLNKEASAWRNSTFYEQQLSQQIAQILMDLSRAIQPQSTYKPPKEYSNHKSFLFFSSTHSPSTKNSQHHPLEKEHVLQTIQTLPVSAADKEQLAHVLDESKESILAEADMWQAPKSFYDKKTEDYVAKLLTDYATQLEDNIMNKKR
ncbi:hypothetical protein [Legionella bozemanae]|uniref:hypothetical protein n=1 Tax=Legionella bozemanae TaxID=447 RepID=UPI00399C8C3D